MEMKLNYFCDDYITSQISSRKIATLFFLFVKVFVAIYEFSDRSVVPEKASQQPGELNQCQVNVGPPSERLAQH